MSGTTTRILKTNRSSQPVPKGGQHGRSRDDRTQKPPRRKRSENGLRTHSCIRSRKAEQPVKLHRHCTPGGSWPLHPGCGSSEVLLTFDFRFATERALSSTWRKTEHLHNYNSGGMTSSWLAKSGAYLPWLLGNDCRQSRPTLRVTRIPEPREAKSKN